MSTSPDEAAPNGDGYRVDLDAYSGPLDLLLYLIKRDEIDIYDIPIAPITDEYLRYLETLQVLNLELAGEFLVMASTLMEIKSRMLLPKTEQLLEEEEDPRADLVRQLLAYKRYREAADALDEMARSRSLRHSRGAMPRDEPEDPAEKPIGEVSLWDLMDSFAKLMKETMAGPQDRVIRADVPIQVYVDRLLDHLRQRGRLRFSEIFGDQKDRQAVIGLFLALLELVRQRRVQAEQAEAFGEIDILLREPPPEPTPGA